MSCDDYCDDTTLELSHCHGGKLIAVPGGTGLPGPAGPAGPEGPASSVPGPGGPAGPAGPQGPAGLGIRYAGEVSDFSELPTSGQKSGDLWVIGNRADDTTPAESWVWDGATSDWIYAGFIQGVQGVAGPVGPAGPAGPTGSQGPAGTTGAQGAPGKDSTVPGPQGQTGATGPVGPASTVPGPQGPAGATGSQGAKGDTGAAGPASTVPGPAGSQGPKGDTGATGSPGATGPQGPQGIPGKDATLPVATATVLGGVRQGAGVTIAADGTLTAAGAVSSVNTRTGAVVLAKADVGLSNVDNTTDAAKPISTATGSALSNKVNGATASGPAAISLWIGTKAQYDALANKVSTCVYVVSGTTALITDAVHEALGVDTGEGTVAE